MDTDDDEHFDAVSSAYDHLAEQAPELDGDGTPWGDSDFQRFFSWPATREVLPELSGKRVLLAGCGRGDHVPWFTEQGADVIGVDASQVALRQARRSDGSHLVVWTPPTLQGRQTARG